MLLLLWQQPFWSAPASSRTTPSLAAAVAATEVAAITEAEPITAAARFMPAVTTAVAMRLRDAAMDIVTR
jgi:hypothetical protein